uniref:Alginate lyase 2 domain-containing protein n=1 Tax=Aegilops tauschii TaxID=37682 RepID=R7W3W4_AEGTA
MAPNLHRLPMPLLVVLLALLSCATHGANAAACDPTTGFVTVPLTDAQLPVQRPYDVPLDQRSGVWQFEGYAFVPSGTTGVSIMQVFGAAKHATTLMLHVYGGALVYYNDWTRVVDRGIYNRWFRLNVIHDVGGGGGVTHHATTLMLHVYGGALVYYNDWTRVVDRGIYNRWFRLNVIHDVGGAGTLTVFIDGQERLRVAGRGGDLHYFKFGVYTQTAPSHLMESRWRDVRLFTKEAY